MAYLVVLAERAAQVAKTEKDGSRTESANQGCLLSKMGVVACNPGLSAGLTEPLLIVQPVYCTLPGAEITLL